MKSRSILVLFLVSILLAIQVPVFTAAPAIQQRVDSPAKIAPTREYIDRWVVQFTPGADITGFIARSGYVLLGNIGGMPGWYEVRIPGTDKDTLAALNAARTMAFSPQVLIFEQQYLIYTTTYDTPPTDPIYASQWHLANTGQFGGTAGFDANVVPVWADNITGNGIHIGVIDDGLQYTHPDLDAPKFIPSRSYDYANNDADVIPSTGGANCSSGDNCHGTSVSGVAAGQANNAVCGAGAAYGATISGQRLIIGIALTDTQIANAFANSQATDTTPVDVSNNSWGYTTGGDPGAAMAAALQNGAVNNNTIYMFAAGNNHPSNAGVSGLVNSRYTIAVGASTNTGVKSSYSQEGSAVFISAPSNGGTAGIYTSDLLGAGDGYGGIGAQPDCTSGFGGTSSATPLTAGVVALMLQANPNLTWRDVQHVLANSATPFDLGDTSWQTNGAGFMTSNKYGFGRVNAEAAVDLAATWTPVDTYINENGPTVAVNQAIADGSGDVTTPVYGAATTSNFNVSGATTIAKLEHVEVFLTVTHAFGGSDLRVQLTSPSGTVSELYDLAAGGPPSFNSGRVLMSVQFWGEDPTGNWTISVQDGWSGDTGTFVSWQLRLYGTEETIVPTATPTDVPPTETPTDVPPTATSTDVPPTITPTDVPPTATSTDVPPTITPTDVPPTETPTDDPGSTATATDDPGSTETPTDDPGSTPTSTTDPGSTATATSDPGSTATPTDDPGSTATPTETVGTELLVNGSFEVDADTNKIPDGWTPANLFGDKRKCNKPEKIIAFDGECVFHFKGSATEKSKISQNPAVTGVLQGDTLALSGYVNAGGAPNAKIKVRVGYVDTSLPKGKITVKVNAATSDWTALAGTLNVVLADDAASIKVIVQNKSLSGKVRFDALSLLQTITEGSVLVPLP